MIEKIGSVKNPLTIIAIFAGIAEVSGTTVLPFITAQNQGIFIYFLIIFPIALILLFFITLNFNNKALYAPSDFNNEENYIKIFRYDISKQQNIEITLTQDNLLKKLNQDFLDLKKINDDKILFLESELKKIKPEKTEEPNTIDFSEVIYSSILVSNFVGVQNFSKLLSKRGYDVTIYYDPFDNTKPFEHEESKAIWLSPEFTLAQVKEVTQLSIKTYPFLKYIRLNGKWEPDYDTTYIGGATDTAIKTFNLKPLNQVDFRKIQAFQTIEDLHHFLRGFDNS